MARNPESAKIHIRLISTLVNKLVGEGYKVSADHIGYPNGLPDEWNGNRPDIHAVKDGKEQLIEAETCDSLDLPETRVQWTALASKPDSDFSIIIPEGCLEKAKKLAKEWSLEIKNFWTMKIG